MRVRLAALLLALAVAPAATGAAALPFKAKLHGATHAPKVNTKWFYSVRVTNLAGKPIRARLTVQVKDPLGGVYPVQFGPTTKNITNWPFKGVFRDYVIWPPSSKLATPLGGLVFRVFVVADGKRTLLRYRVKPR